MTKETKDKITAIIQEIPQYSDKTETLFKDAVWFLSWLGGIYTTRSIDDTQFVRSSYFLYSLALLMEFAPRIKRKKHLFSRVHHLLFCAPILFILLKAAGLLFGHETNDQRYILCMYILSIITIVFLALDLIISWLCPSNQDSVNSSESINLEDVSQQQKQQLFCMALKCGKLGSVEGEDHNNG